MLAGLAYIMLAVFLLLARFDFAACAFQATLLPRRLA
jgi:hypothetical protein